MKVKSLSRVRLFATPWTAASQAPPSMGFSRQEYWSGLPLPSPGDLPDPGIEPGFPALASGFFTTEPPEAPTSFHLKDVLLIRGSLEHIFSFFSYAWMLRTANKKLFSFYHSHIVRIIGQL